MEAMRQLALLMLCCHLAPSAGRTNQLFRHDYPQLVKTQLPKRLALGKTLSPTGRYEDACESGTYPPPASRSVPHYVINLDLPPEYRYCQLMEDMGPATSSMLDVIRQEATWLFGKRVFQTLEALSKIIGRNLPYPFHDEIRGIALASGMSEGDVTLINIFYEIFTVCTSVVAKDDNGTLYHGRNMDFGLFLGWDKVNHTWRVTEALRPMTVTLEYQRANRTLFRTASFAGMVGVLTGVRPGQFSLTINERFTRKPGVWYIMKWALGTNVQWNTVISRQVLENGTDYSSVQKQLASTPLIAPVYFILGAAESSEGCVITRDQYKADIWPLGTDSYTQKSKWYLLQTNYDHWERPPFFDNRRDPGIRCMDRVGQAGFNAPALSDVLSSKPVRNRMTVYTALMEAARGSLEAWLQYCDDPDCAIL